MTQWACCLLHLSLVVGCQSKTSVPVKTVRSHKANILPMEAKGLHNFFRVTDRIYSGSSPNDDAGFASLAQLGIKTIVSVDGAKPDVELAARHGIKYVHLPFSYDGVPRNRILQLAKVAADRSGPIYVHCHHGLHRGPVAVAVMQLCNDPTWDASSAELWLQQAGTSPQYPGLIHMPGEVVPPTDDELASISNQFPSSASVNDLASLMVEVDARWDRLKHVKSAGWKTPDGHPDIDPPHEVVQLIELYRESARLDAAKKRGSFLLQHFRDAEEGTRPLETELRSKPINPDRVAEAFKLAAAQCAACHNQFRDRPNHP